MFGIAESLLLVLPLLHSPELANAREWGEKIEKVWFAGRPEWAEMAISILKGEAMRPDKAWWRSTKKVRDGRWLLARFDSNGDGLVSHAELPVGDAELVRLDRDRDGDLTPKDLEGGPGRSSPAGAWFRELDANSNGRVTRKELDDFFEEADEGKLGFLTPEDLQAFLLRDEPPPSKGADDDDDDGMPPPLVMLQMLFSGQLGSLTEGPGAGDPAPDFHLPALDGKSEISLSSSRGKKPVVLVFGSFT